MPMAQKKERRGAKSSMLPSRREPGANVFQAVGQGVGQFDVGRGPGLLHVVAGDGDELNFGISRAV
jgi:hypothetical protein